MRAKRLKSRWKTRSPSSSATSRRLPSSRSTARSFSCTKANTVNGSQSESVNRGVQENTIVQQPQCRSLWFPRRRHG